MRINNIHYFDIVITGSGPASHVLASALENAFPEKKIAWVRDHSDLEEKKMDLRKLALSYSSLSILRKLKLISYQKIGHYIQRINVSDEGHFGKVFLNASKIGVPYLGAVLSFNELLKNLKLEKCSIYRDSVCEINQNEKEIKISLSDNQKITTKLVINTDRTTLPLSTMQKFEFNTKDFGQFAITADIIFEYNNNNEAFERFTEEGPFALLPFSDNAFNMVWCLNERKKNFCSLLNDKELISLIQKKFGWKLGKICSIDNIAFYDLKRETINNFFSHRILNIGSFANKIHPVAGQGFNLTIRDINTVINTLTQYEDPGSWISLNSIEKNRKIDQQNIIWFTEGLIHLFSNKELSFFRSLGLSIFNNFNFLQQSLTKFIIKDEY